MPGQSAVWKGFAVRLDSNRKPVKYLNDNSHYEAYCRAEIKALSILIRERENRQSAMEMYRDGPPVTEEEANEMGEF